MFEIGGIYNRRLDIHKEFGGNRQSGIVTCPRHPYIFLFSSDKGEEFGYKDGWISDDLFRYSGEGQFGNQEFVRGNRAIRDHMIDGKELHLFERHEVGTYKYCGKLVFEAFEIVSGEDANNRARTLIKFLLRRG